MLIEKLNVAYNYMQFLLQPERLAKNEACMKFPFTFMNMSPSCRRQNTNAPCLHAHVFVYHSFCAQSLPLASTPLTSTPSRVHQSDSTIADSQP